MVTEGGICKLCLVDHRVDENGTVMREGSGDSVLDLGGVAANTDRFGHCREIRILELGPEIWEARGLLLKLPASSWPVVEGAACGYSPPQFPHGALLVPGATLPVTLRLLLDRPSVTAKSPGSVVSLLRTPKSGRGLSLSAELVGSNPRRLPGSPLSWANTGAATVAMRSTAVPSVLILVICHSPVWTTLLLASGSPTRLLTQFRNPARQLRRYGNRRGGNRSR